jgi:hypothetical protein
VEARVVDDLLQVAVCAVAVCGRGLDLRDAGLARLGCDDVWTVEAGVVNDVQQDAEDWRLAWLMISGRTVGCVVGRRGMRIWGRQRRGRMAWCSLFEVGDYA